MLSILLITFSSCKKNFLREELNDDPTSLNNADPKVILPTAISNLAYYYGGDIARYNAMIMQQVVGGGNQWIAFQNYNFVDADFDNNWNAIYSTTLNSLNKMEKYSNEKNFVHYEGISKILKGFAFSVLVDHYGDIPFKEALQAPEILQPKFDAGSNVYEGIFKLLDDGEILLSKTDNGRIPGEDDIMFGGDIVSWTAFSHAIKARMYMHTQNYVNATSELVLADGIDAKFNFNAPSSGPMSQFNDNRVGDITYMDSYLYQTMSSLGDARIYNYVDTSEDDLGVFLGTPSQPIYFISSLEQKFMEAEILARSADVTANTVFEEAIDMSFAISGGDTSGRASSIAAYPYNNSDPLNDRLKAVMMQKYFAMFLQPESFSDWRRTGFPALVPTTGSNIPRRYLYPTDEKNTNPNTPKGVTLYSPKVFWDN